MNLFSVFKRFPDQQACIDHLEAVRWGGEPECLFCQSENVARKAEKGRVGRWNCHACHNSYNVLSGTIFEKTQIPLQKWFVAISLMLNAQKSLSSYQLGRDIEVNQRSAWYMQQRIRAAMTENDKMLHGIVEADETYVGGKPRRANKKEDHTPNKPGRGTKKTAVIGAIERGGSVVTQVAKDLTGKALIRFLQDNIDVDNILLITDEYTGYKAVEGFWALLKRPWYGQHHHYSKLYMPLYVTETAWKYNERKNPNAFQTFLWGCF